MANLLDVLFMVCYGIQNSKGGRMAKGNRNKRCEVCGRRHNPEKPCKVVTTEPEAAPEPEETPEPATGGVFAGPL